MSPIQTSLQKVFIECLQCILGPIVRLTLHCGLGHSEFSAAVRRVFVEVASEEFGVRGRPANAAKIAALTGLPRKFIRLHRDQPNQVHWTPDDEVSPINTIIHYWRFDERFCSTRGSPRDLVPEGDNGFSGLVKSYAGDIPHTAIRQALLREGIAEYTDDRLLRLLRDYSFPDYLDEDFLRNAAFSISHHAETLVFNARRLISKNEPSMRTARDAIRYLERIAWSRRLKDSDLGRFQDWIFEEGGGFIQRADEYIASKETVGPIVGETENDVCGVGIYFFRGKN